MGRHSEMEPLVDRILKSPLARERAKVILLTMGGGWTVKQGCERLGISRTRFQVLRRRFLAGAGTAVEERPQGRPPKPVAEVSETELHLMAEIETLQRELENTRVELDLMRSGIGEAVERRLHAKAVRR